jgi:hypothetical protein
MGWFPAPGACLKGANRMLFDLWMLTRALTPDIGSAPSPPGPPPR